MDILSSIAPLLILPALASSLLVYKYFYLSKEEYDIYKKHIDKTFSKVKYEFTNNEELLKANEKQKQYHDETMRIIRHSFEMGKIRR